MIFAPQGFEFFPILVSPLTVPYQTGSEATSFPRAPVAPLDEIRRLNPGTDGLGPEWIRGPARPVEVGPGPPFGRRWTDRLSTLNNSLEQSVAFDNSLLSHSSTQHSRPGAFQVTAIYESTGKYVDHPEMGNLA